jgi:DNA modification methylase
MSDPIIREVTVGDQRLIQGDCLEVMPLLGKVDAVVTDPPYGIGSWSANASGGFVDAAQAQKTKKWDARAAELPREIFERPSIVWGGNYFNLPKSPKVLIWDKQQKGMHFAEAEIAWTNFDKGTTRIFSYGVKGSDIHGPGKRQHPTQKPVALMEWCLGFLPDAKTILDPFMGSGTTLVACAKLGRKGIGIELDPDYFDIAVERVRKAYEQPDMFVPAPSKPIETQPDLLDEENP